MLHLPDATLAYTVQGHGPVLLLVPGGSADAGFFTQLVPELTDDYTVVAYDPRGLSRSHVVDRTADISIQTLADDAHYLLAAITDKPALVFGNSGGAITGLELMQRHPTQVRRLIAHEPPLTELLPDALAQRAERDALYQTYQREGAGAAMRHFLQTAFGFTLARGWWEDDARALENLDLFFGQMLLPLTSYVPDLAVLRPHARNVVVAQGTTSVGQTAHRAAARLAELLGAPLLTFPGGHGDIAANAGAFGHAIRDADARKATAQRT
jgi:pimeloyl-ACP methyl ester carboxylesterase